jgi:predicted Zn-dependent protease with MMP-like domain
MPRLTIRSQLASMTRMKRMSRQQFHDLLIATVNSLPEPARKLLHNIAVDVEEEPDEETLRDLGFSDEEIDEGATLYGLFGPMRGFTHDIDDPHRIIVYKRQLEEDFPDQDELIEEIRKTVLHELHHHFGYTERDISTWTDLE